eukprot:Gb_28327 [translate_table: standard]
MDYTYYGYEFYGVGKGHITNHQQAQQRILCVMPRPPITQFPVMAHPEVVGHVSHHLMRVLETIHVDIQPTFQRIKGIISSQTLSTEPSHSGGGKVDSRPSHGNMSHIPRYVSNDEFLNVIVDDACYEYVTSVGMSIDVQTIQTKNFEEPSVDLPSNPTMGISYSTITPETHDPMPSPFILETRDPTTSPLGLEPIGIDGHRVTSIRSQQNSEDLEDGDRSQCLRHETHDEDIIPPKDFISS